MAYKLGVILTTYKSWDDPPSSANKNVCQLLEVPLEPPNTHGKMKVWKTPQYIGEIIPKNEETWVPMVVTKHG